MEKVKKGDEHEFSLLFSLFYPKLMSLACRFVPEYIAEDLVQGVFVMYWENKHCLECCNTLSFFYKCTQNSCLNYLKHQAVINRHEEEVRLAEERITFQLSQSNANDLWDKVVESNIKEILERSVSKLPPKCRQAFELSFFGEKTYKEIAEIMHISSRTVEEHVQKAMKILRSDLKDILFYLCLCLFKSVL
ncbi:RNA polymerase sigma-70 factor [Phocaeicola oris]|uniref:RNA polymerase sigma-70 factor n=1 Tax=Phocaeicola oris TaxID=2896850 RepID=UPI00234F3E46|nr:RNA polymerase sigma-70 factor [Phocaeicola oris]MCE2616970.1 RNA polymerase sigma-70 factor [Phocaeicola oris]